MEKIFKQAINKKKGRKLLILEFVMAYVVVFCLTIFGMKATKDYFRPVGFNYKSFIELGVSALETKAPKDSLDQGNAIFQQIINVIKDQKEVVDYSLIKGFVPFVGNAPIIAINSNQIKTNAFCWIVDDNFQKMLELPLRSGRWFDKQDNGASVKPIVLNKELTNDLFPDGYAVGQRVFINNEEFRVVGITDNFYPLNSSNLKGFFLRNTPGSEYFDQDVRFLVKFIGDFDGLTRLRYNDLLSEIVKDKSSKETYANSLVENRKRQWSTRLLFVSTLFIVVIFLIVNLLLGLISVLRLTINKRRTEIGIRRATGASKKRIYLLILNETLSISLIGSIIGIVLVFQFYVFDLFSIENMYYLAAIILSLIILFILVALFSLFPAFQAAKIQPAVALHEE
jgi:putative ABC transport system permease protein